MATTTPTHLQDIGAKHVTKGLGRIAGDAVMVRAQGSWAEFEDGRVVRVQLGPALLER